MGVLGEQKPLAVGAYHRSLIGIWPGENRLGLMSLHILFENPPTPLRIGLKKDCAAISGPTRHKRIPTVVYQRARGSEFTRSHDFGNSRSSCGVQIQERKPCAWRIVISQATGQVTMLNPLAAYCSFQRRS